MDKSLVSFKLIKLHVEFKAAAIEVCKRQSLLERWADGDNRKKQKDYIRYARLAGAALDSLIQDAPALAAEKLTVLKAAFDKSAARYREASKSLRSRLSGEDKTEARRCEHYAQKVAELLKLF